MPEITSNIARPIPATAKILAAKDMKPAEIYQTVQSGDPKKQYMARLVEMRATNVLIEAYYPGLRSWSRVEVPHNYRLIPYPKENLMKTKAGRSTKTSTRTLKNKVETLADKPVRDENYGKQAPQALGKKSGGTVYEVWGKAFAQYGTHGDAPEKIVKHMETEYPGRKTLWKKWVNAVRARFNGGKLPGVKRPVSPIPVYRSAFLGNEKRDLPERREETAPKKAPTKLKVKKNA